MTPEPEESRDNREHSKGSPSDGIGRFEAEGFPASERRPIKQTPTLTALRADEDLVQKYEQLISDIGGNLVRRIRAESMDLVIPLAAKLFDAFIKRPFDPSDETHMDQMARCVIAAFSEAVTTLPDWDESFDNRRAWDEAEEIDVSVTEGTSSYFQWGERMADHRLCAEMPASPLGDIKRESWQNVARQRLRGDTFNLVLARTLGRAAFREQRGDELRED